MEDVSVQIDAKSFDKTATVVVDMDSLQQPTDRSSPKMIRALSRKWSYRAERLTNPEEEDIDESSKRTAAKVLNTQLEPLKQSLLSNKSMNTNSANQGGSNLLDAADGRNKKLNRFVAINPRKILCIFATLSSMGSLVLIYFTLAMNVSF
ncbi:uncharacterized protein LOC127809509 isoform X5 [Diospyros lotus]|uniref:uncharacterized protein LOC127809509 isoform X5 n=1 Tax=Diospyros lotus TaxID=55363 RepID=UPI0022536B64|nr:uncharacterized protein LOC127809509 isoform X5 [Diospyros lotus]XP_052204307.1 uncharacterized protein LOC127809509 isoform X5 [Diospyros lotus]